MKRKLFNSFFAPFLSLVLILTPVCALFVSASDEQSTSQVQTSEATTEQEPTSKETSTTKKDEEKTTSSSKGEIDKLLEAEKNAKSKKIRNQIAMVQARLNKLKNQSDKLEEYQMNLETKTALLQSEIDALNEELAPIEADIAENQKAIKKYNKELAPIKKEVAAVQSDVDEVKAQMDRVYSDYCQKQKSMYLNGCSSIVSLLLGADSFANFLVRLQLIVKISKIDADNLSSLKSKLDEYNKTLLKYRQKSQRVKSLEQSIKSTNAVIKAQKDIVKTKTASLKEEQADLIKSMEEYSENLKKLYSKQYDASAQVAELRGIDNQLNGITVDETAKGVNSYRTTGFTWPVPSCRYISCGFYGYANHGGIDIPGSYGADIVAIAGGVVVTVVHQTTSYGNYCIIYHGDGIYSLYAHCSLLKVNVGQSVEKGETIARVGNIGNVRPRPTPQFPYAGSHLHIGIKKNGSWVNPSNYLSP